MAIDLQDFVSRSRLQSSIRNAWEGEAPSREARKDLIRVFSDKPAWFRAFDDPKRCRTLINLFQQYVRGHVVSVAYNVPKWHVKAHTSQGRGLDFRIQNLLNRFNSILGMQSLLDRWGVDSAFGRTVAKVCTGIAPKGITAPVSPRVYRISPNQFLMDPTASCPDEASWMADFYLVPLNEAQNYEDFDAEGRYKLVEYTGNSTDSMLPEGYDPTSFAEPMVRLIDVYIPSRGVIATWACASDSFSEIGSELPLMEREIPINPYEVLDITFAPDETTEFSLLDSLRPLHELTNDMLVKAATQARASKRNPMFKIGPAEHDMDRLLMADDNEPVGVTDPDDVGLYELKGADPGLVSMGQLALGLFSQFGGNLEVALGQSAGASTARQTQALISQLSSVQGVVKGKFDRFLSNIGKKLATLAFLSESLQLDIEVQIPGTTYSLNWGWAPAHLLPRTAGIDDFGFEVAPYSTALRTPEQHIQQLEAASRGIAQWMVLAAQGAPVNLQAIIKSYSDAFDLVGDLEAWWSGEEVKPDVAQRAASHYSSSAGGGPSQREINYQGAGGQGSGGGQYPAQEPGGLSGFGQ